MWRNSPLDGGTRAFLPAPRFSFQPLTKFVLHLENYFINLIQLLVMPGTHCFHLWVRLLVIQVRASAAYIFPVSNPNWRSGARKSISTLVNLLVTVCCSAPIKLPRAIRGATTTSVTIISLEQYKGFEPSPPVWKTGMLTIKH